MRVVVDVSPAVNSKAGLGRYAATLVEHLRHTWVGEHLYLFYNRRHGGTVPWNLSTFPSRRVSLGYKPWRMLVWLGHVGRIPFDRLLPSDTRLFHATEHLLLPLRHIPAVFTVHDLIFEKFPQYHKPLNLFYLKHTVPVFVRRSAAVITISQASKQDLISLYRVPAQKIHVIYEAPAPHFRPVPPENIAAIQRKYHLPPRYLLTVGTLEPRKNLVTLLRSFEKVYASGLVDALVIVGQKGWLYEDFFNALENSSVRDRVILTGFVPDEDLPAVYAGALVFVFPSYYEGFGLPLLEAMAVGVPVVASSAPPLPEIGGDAALYASPDQCEEFVTQILAYLRDETLREEMRERGWRRARQFSWERTATQTAAVYAQVLAQGTG